MIGYFDLVVKKCLYYAKKKLYYARVHLIGILYSFGCSTARQ